VYSFTLSGFALEILVQIYLAEISGNPIKKYHGWCTARGNSIDVIKEVLIADNLVQEIDGCFLTEEAGRKMVLLFWQKMLTYKLFEFIS